MKLTFCVAVTPNGKPWSAVTVLRVQRRLKD